MSNDATAQLAEIRISGVQERDIDLLLLEEFYAGDEFWRWFVEKSVAQKDERAAFRGAFRSVTQSNGESDLELSFSSGDGTNVRLLIENKVATGFQPAQALRYRARGENYRINGVCDRFETVLVAPDAYMKHIRETPDFDGYLSYETIREWFHDHPTLGARSSYKIVLLDTAIRKSKIGALRKSKLGLVSETDAPVTSFWRGYWELASQEIPELQMGEPNAVPSASTWVTFRPSGRVPGISLVHKMEKGWVDIQFSKMGDRLSELGQSIGSLLEPGMTIQKATGSAAVRVEVPQLDVARPFQPQIEDVVLAQAAAKRLYGWFLQHREILKCIPQSKAI